MIFEDIIKAALSPDPMETAKARVQTRKVGQIIRERQAVVHAALKRAAYPAEQSSNPAGQRVAS